MGFGGISIWQLLIVLAIVVLIFGTKRLRNIGGDLGGAIKSFKQGLKEDDESSGEEELSKHEKFSKQESFNEQRREQASDGEAGKVNQDK